MPAKDSFDLIEKKGKSNCGKTYLEIFFMYTFVVYIFD